MNTTDQRIDHLLHTLGTASTPTGLEQRVHARLAQRAASRERTTLLFNRRAVTTWMPRLPLSVLWPGAVLTTGILVVGAICLFHFTHTQPQPIAYRPAPVLLPEPSPEQAASVLPVLRAEHTAEPSRQTAAAGPQATLSASDDPDAIALAETLAPSHPAPPLPLTSQETLLLHSTRRGQPIEIAELDTLRESALSNIAAAHERASVREYIHGLLGPLATAQSLTPSTPAPDDSKPVADIEPPASK